MGIGGNLRRASCTESVTITYALGFDGQVHPLGSLDKYVESLSTCTD
jgi:hypothetical protein